MALKKYEEADIAAIASAIREKTGNDKTYKVSQMDEGVNEVYEAGKKAEYDAFWDAFQNYGARTNYQYAFARGNFSENTFYPKYDIVFVDSGVQAFYSFIGNRNEATEPTWDLKARLEECDVVIDTSKATNLSSMFCYARISAIPTIDLTGINIEGGDNQVFAYCWERLVTIEKIIVKESNKFYRTFHSDTGLRNITIEGVIGNDFDIHWSPLTKASIESIMTHLSPTATFTVTLSQTAVNNAFTADEWQEIINNKPTNVNVTLSLI